LYDENKGEIINLASEKFIIDDIAEEHNIGPALETLANERVGKVALGKRKREMEEDQQKPNKRKKGQKWLKQVG
jgi:hypothetical protein